MHCTSGCRGGATCEQWGMTSTRVRPTGSRFCVFVQQRRNADESLERSLRVIKMVSFTYSSNLGMRATLTWTFQVPLHRLGHSSRSWPTNGPHTMSLPPPRRLYFCLCVCVSLSVSLSAFQRRPTQKVLDEFWWILEGSRSRSGSTNFKQNFYHGISCVGVVLRCPNVYETWVIYTEKDSIKLQ